MCSGSSVMKPSSSGRGKNGKNNNQQIAIFWDYCTLTLAQSCDPALASTMIADTLSKHGKIVQRRLYSSSTEHLFATLTVPGFEHVTSESPNETKNRVIADMLTFAWDYSKGKDVTQQKPCVTLITSDMDFLYTLSNLRTRGVKIIVISMGPKTPTNMRGKVDEVLSFDSLFQQSKSFVAVTSGPSGGSMEKSQAPPKSQKTGKFAFVRLLPRSVNLQEFVQFLESAVPVHVLRAILEFPTGNPTLCNAHVEFAHQEDVNMLLRASSTENGERGIVYGGRPIVVAVDMRPSVMNSIGEKDVYYEVCKSGTQVAFQSSEREQLHADVARLCGFIYILTKKGTVSDNRGWIGAARVGQEFRSEVLQEAKDGSPSDETKKRFKYAREVAVMKGYVEMGRRRLGSSLNEYTAIPLKPSKKERNSPFLSPEIYLKLLPAGHNLAENRDFSSVQPRKRPSFRSCIFCNNFPPDVTTSEVVELFATLQCTVGRMELQESIWKGNPSTCAHIQFVDAESLSRALAASKESGIECRRRHVYVTLNRTTPDAIAKGSSSLNQHSYTRNDWPGTPKKLPPLPTNEPTSPELRANASQQHLESLPEDKSVKSTVETEGSASDPDLLALVDATGTREDEGSDSLVWE